MDRNDLNYFKRITPEFVESLYGSDYDVPANIKRRVFLIMRRFTIFGLSDAGYIANTIAKENGSGDGEGNFRNAPIEKIKEIAAALKNAYGCNIYDCDMECLEDILLTGDLPKELMIAGLKNSIRIRKERIENERDEWRKEFLYGEIEVIKDSIQRVTAGK